MAASDDPKAAQSQGPTPAQIEQEKQNAEIQKQLQLERDRLALENSKSATEDREYARAKAKRDQDLAEGRARGNELFGDRSLGRLEEGRGKEISDLIAERKARSAGYTKEEMGGMREQNLSQIQQAGQGQERELRIQQARAGVRGPAALAQQAKLMQAQGAQQAGLERELFLGNIQRRDQGLNALEESTNKARAEEMARGQFNIGQSQREKFGQLATEMGYGSLGANERGAVMNKIVGENQAAAGLQAAQQGGKK